VTEELPAPGTPAPAFALPDGSGQIYRLGEEAKAPLVLFFFPRADTPGCTTEAEDFTRLLPQFQASGWSVIGMSADPPPKLARFAEKRKLTVTLLSDEAHDTLRAYGVWGQKSMYGKSFEGILRSTVLIGRDNRIAQTWRVTKVAGHADSVLGAARKIP
jgi:peroxiredoxin Q/BCP